MLVSRAFSSAPSLSNDLTPVLFFSSAGSRFPRLSLTPQQRRWSSTCRRRRLSRKFSSLRLGTRCVTDIYMSLAHLLSSPAFAKFYAMERRGRPKDAQGGRASSSFPFPLQPPAPLSRCLSPFSLSASFFLRQLPLLVVSRSSRRQEMSKRREQRCELTFPSFLPLSVDENPHIPDSDSTSSLI